MAMRENAAPTSGPPVTTATFLGEDFAEHGREQLGGPGVSSDGLIMARSPAAMQSMSGVRVSEMG